MRNHWLPYALRYWNASSFPRLELNIWSFYPLVPLFCCLIQPVPRNINVSSHFFCLFPNFFECRPLSHLQLDFEGSKIPINGKFIGKSSIDATCYCIT